MKKSLKDTVKRRSFLFCVLKEDGKKHKIIMHNFVHILLLVVSG